LWRMVQADRHLFLSKQSAAQFLGFAGNQLRRITGEKGRGAKGRRPEYESVFWLRHESGDALSAALSGMH
jgi:hypothetical protein